MSRFFAVHDQEPSVRSNPCSGWQVWYKADPSIVGLSASLEAAGRMIKLCRRVGA